MSDLIAKRLGSGGLKFGGGVIDTDDEVEVEVEVVSVSDIALMQILFLGISFVLENETGLWTENWEKLRVPVPAMAITLEKEQFVLLLEGEVNSVWEFCEYF